MVKILNSSSRGFGRELDKLLSARKSKVQSSSISVTNIIKDVKKNGDKALLKYEKKFNKNSIIVPTSKQISNSIKTLDKKVNSICKFDFVDQVKSKNIDQKNEDLTLELIGIDYLKNKDDFEINLIFNNNAHISLKSETIEVRLEDQNEIK